MSDGHVEIRNVTVTHASTHALDDVSLSLQPGEAVALVGLSGAGKSTLLSVCSGMIRPDSGSVEVNGHELAKLTAAQLRRIRSRIGFIHQDFSLVPNLRVLQNVVSGRLGERSFLGGVRDFLFPADDVVQQVYEILDSVGIAEKLYERTDRLSGGQRQRVAIARALFQSPDIILADEPISSVDPARAQRTIALLRQICTDRGLTLCVSLHNLELARAYFPRLIALKSGRVLFDKSVGCITQVEFDELYHIA
ncbi:MAG: phosphonate ABC transporter ATP-binding protein [Gammaproteobacteria bacterium]|nr:phosphonate ABC transporter ATP-binding protein [Gammaproteobacteria bacterium]